MTEAIVRRATKAIEQANTNFGTIYAMQKDAAGALFCLVDLREVVRDLLTDRLSHAWRDIATAPKDGTPLLLARKLLSGELIVASGSWNSGGSMHMPHWMSAILGFQPTHWLPLPPGPETTT